MQSSEPVNVVGRIVLNELRLPLLDAICLRLAIGEPVHDNELLWAYRKAWMRGPQIDSINRELFDRAYNRRFYPTR